MAISIPGCFSIGISPRRTGLSEGRSWECWTYTPPTPVICTFFFATKRSKVQVVCAVYDRVPRAGY